MLHRTPPTAALFAAFSVPGKFGLKVQTLNVTVPDVVVVAATGIKIGYDPNATGPQELLRLQSASVTFQAVGLSANIGPSSQRPYGLIVRSDGFDLGHLDVTYRPGTTAVGGTPEVVHDGVTGVLVPPRQPAALADAMIALSASPERRHALGVVARLSVEERFAIDGMVERYAHVYERLAG